MVRYYGYYSNVSRGKRQREGMDDAIPFQSHRHALFFDVKSLDKPKQSP